MHFILLLRKLCEPSSNLLLVGITVTAGNEQFEDFIYLFIFKIMILEQKTNLMQRKKMFAFISLSK